MSKCVLESFQQSFVRALQVCPTLGGQLPLRWEKLCVVKIATCSKVIQTRLKKVLWMLGWLFVMLWHVEVYFGVIPAKFCVTSAHLSHSGWATAFEVGKNWGGKEYAFSQNSSNMIEKGLMDTGMTMCDALA